MTEWAMIAYLVLAKVSYILHTSLLFFKPYAPMILSLKDDDYNQENVKTTYSLSNLSFSNDLFGDFAVFESICQ